MLSGLPFNLAGVANQVANIIGINDWALQEASYNGAQFHWMVPSYSGLNPLDGVISYVQSDLSNEPQKLNYGTWSNIVNMRDSVSRKLAVFPVPNYDGFYIEDFGANGVPIDIIGIIYGPDYLEVLEKCLIAFNDVETFPGSGIGKVSGNNFRQFVHPVFGVPPASATSITTQTNNNVFFARMDVITSSDKFRAASFRLSLLSQTPSYLLNVSTVPSWQEQAQGVLNQAQNITVSIAQTEPLIEIGKNLISGSDSLQQKLRILMSGKDKNSLIVTDNGETIPIINGRGQYVQSLENQIQNQLNALVNIFNSSMAFFVQNSAGQIQSPYWNAIVIDYSVLPIYIAETVEFSFSDAQIIISSYAQKIIEFIAYAEANRFQYVLQDNIDSMKTSLVYLNNIAELFLAQDGSHSETLTSSPTDLYSLMSFNDIDLNKFNEINDLNRGVWFSCLKIPAGTIVNLS